MYLEEIHTKNFRNLTETTLALSKGINIFYGQNAQGKTNLIESIYFCATGRSYRTYNYKEMIHFDKREAYVKAKIKDEHLKDRIEITIGKDKKNILINGVSVKKLGELFGTFLVVIFSPEDLELVKAGPTIRRKLLDLNLCQLSKIYYYELGRYYHVLKQRNNLLKNVKKDKSLSETIFIWDEQLISHGQKIFEFRASYIEELNKIASDIHKNLTGNKEKLEISYRPNVTLEEFEDKLTKSLERDIYLGSTSVGIHKDDIGISINGVDTKNYGSQGQQRTASLSIKLSSIDYIYEKKKTYPILLLDDVLSELDKSRQKFLLSQIQNIQTLITCTGVEDVISNLALSQDLEMQLYEVREGFITKE